MAPLTISESGAAVKSASFVSTILSLTKQIANSVMKANGRHTRNVSNTTMMESSIHPHFESPHLLQVEQPDTDTIIPSLHSGHFEDSSSVSGLEGDDFITALLILLSIFIAIVNPQDE